MASPPPALVPNDSLSSSSASPDDEDETMRLRSTTPASKLLAKSHQFIAKRRSHQHKQRKEEDDPLDLPHVSPIQRHSSSPVIRLNEDDEESQPSRIVPGLGTLVHNLSFNESSCSDADMNRDRSMDSIERGEMFTDIIRDLQRLTPRPELNKLIRVMEHQDILHRANSKLKKEREARVLQYSSLVDDEALDSAPTKASDRKVGFRNSAEVRYFERSRDEIASMTSSRPKPRRYDSRLCTAEDSREIASFYIEGISSLGSSLGMGGAENKAEPTTPEPTSSFSFDKVWKQIVNLLCLDSTCDPNIPGMIYCQNDCGQDDFFAVGGKSDGTPSTDPDSLYDTSIDEPPLHKTTISPPCMSQPEPLEPPPDIRRMLNLSLD